MTDRSRPFRATGVASTSPAIRAGIKLLPVVAAVLTALAFLLSASDAEPASLFPHPHGHSPPYGMMACETPSPVNPCVEAGFTAYHMGFASSLTIQDQIDLLRQARDAGILKNYLLTTPHDGPTGYGTYLQYFQALKTRAQQEGLLGWAGLHHRDEPTDLALTQTIRNAYLSVFPDHFTFLYGQDEYPETWASATDVEGFTGYTDYQDRIAAFIYFRLSYHAHDVYNRNPDPTWYDLGKTVWLTTEAFDDATYGEDAGAHACTRPDAYQRSVHQIVQSIVGGAQGIYGYGGIYAYVPPCRDTVFAAHRDFLPKYQNLWPWIEELNRTKLPVTPLTGPDELCSGEEIEYILCDVPVVAFRFVDGAGRQMLAVVNLLGNPESGGASTTARIGSVPNGPWYAWSSWGASGGPVNVTNNSITGTWAPYGYTFYVLGQDGPTPSPDPGDDPTPTTIPPGEDTDGDGCRDGIEAGADPALGGLRDPNNFWDFFDLWTGTPLRRDGRVDIADIGALLRRFGSSRQPPPAGQAAIEEALTPPQAASGYHAAFDRGGPRPGSYIWDLLPPNGLIDTVDVGSVVAQFGHSCP